MSSPDREQERWRRHAACAGIGPAVFYDPSPAAVAAAKRICATCPVRTSCHRHAVTTDEPDGIWGGHTAAERAATHPTPSTPGPAPQVSDAELVAVFTAADPDTTAIEVLRRHTRLPSATAYATLARAVTLGVVERRGRHLHPRP